MTKFSHFPDVNGKLLEFDNDFYQNPYSYGGDEALSPQQHYTTIGWKEFLNPSENFDTLFYYMTLSGLIYPDLCPLLHYNSIDGKAPRNRTEALTSGLPPIDTTELIDHLPGLYDLFDAEYYTTRYPDVITSNLPPFQQYLQDGWKIGRNPSPDFETLFYREYFMHNDSADICPLVHYFCFGRSAGLPTNYAESRHRAIMVRSGKSDPTEDLLPTLSPLSAAVLMAPHFNPSFYLSFYSDLAAAKINPFWHYTRTGWREGRLPKPSFDTEWYVSRFVKLEHRASVSPLLHMSTIGRMADLPLDQGWSMQRAEQAADAVWTDWLKSFLHSLGIDTRIYAGDHIRGTVLPMFSVADYRNRKGIDDSVSDIAAFLRYLTIDLPTGMPPGPMFSGDYYLSELQRMNLPLPKKGESLFLHWLTNSLPRGVSPTPAFSSDDYLKLNKDLENYPGPLFDHFIRHGLNEGRRFNVLTTIATSPTSQLRKDSEPLANRYCEVVARSAEKSTEFLTMRDFLKSGKLAETVAEAAEIEPDIGTLSNNVHAMIPPWHDALWLGYADVISLLPEGNFDAVVLMPFCKLGGADFVAGVLSSELSKTGRTLVLRTDASDWARPDWFAPEVETVDLSAHLATFSQAIRMRILYFLILRTGAKDVYNVNSRLAFDTFETYGERLALSTRLHAYYFCADRTPEGIETGYPIWYFSKILPCLTTAMIDNAPLAEQLIERFCLSGALRNRVKVFYTPVMTNHEIRLIAEKQVETVISRRRKRILWAGRFDRQKRFDLLVGVAQLMPEVDFIAWGKAVLDAPPDMNNLPPNLSINGPFVSYDELPLDDSDGWLYTSTWDGIPTILIELGSMGIPIVASTAGGVSEVIDATTGWPVPAGENVQAYAHALEHMLASAEERVKRAAALQDRILARHSRANYAAALGVATTRTRKSANV